MRFMVGTFRGARWLGVALAASLLLGCPAAAQTAIAPEELTDAHVQKAIDALVNALYERKDSQRFWELARTPPGESSKQGGGYTALTALALVSAGQSYQDPRLRDALESLASRTMEGTYAVCARALLWSKLPTRFHDLLMTDVRWLVDGFSEKTGGWDYTRNPTAKYHDNSIRQFGALALWEAAKRDVKIDRQFWQRLEDVYINSQLPDGGWNYKGEGPSTGSMTAAGLATLFITQDLLHAAESVRLGASARARHQIAIDKALAWMDHNFSPTSNPGKDWYFFYYLFSVERAGLASGYRYFGGHDWFREGAAEIIRRLCKWDASTSTFEMKAAANSPTKTDEIAFSLMFLSRGRVPVAMNTLQFDGSWNNRPRAVANLTRWIGENSETDLNWQIVNLKSSPESWLDAPLLVIASDEGLPWLKAIATDAAAYAREAKDFIRRRALGEIDDSEKPPAAPNSPELAKLKRYLDRGGMIFAINEGGSRAFSDSMERAGLLMYPQYEWRTLPEDHWAYTIHAPVKGKRLALRAISNGVRELIILAPGGDLTGVFQKAETRQIGPYQTAANIYYYASEMNRARPRLQATASNDRQNAAKAVTIVRALHEDNWKPEPQALEIFADDAAARHGLKVSIIDHPLARIGELSPRPALVVVNGVETHQFTAGQISSIRKYVDAGGVILFETPGGVGEFTASAEQMAASVFGKPVQSVLRSPMITGEGLKGAIDLTKVEYRPFSLQRFGTRDTAPRLRGMTLDEKRGPQLLFSREDISNALLDQPCWGVSGYSPESARALMANIVKHAQRMATTRRAADYAP